MVNYHEPVLLNEAIEGLNIEPNGTYVDATFGGGGHSRAILEKLTGGRLLAFDQDPDAAKNAIADERFLLIAQNFRFLKNFCRLYQAIPVSGILADLGVSSNQFDTPEKGFSIRYDAPLDMRMDPSMDHSAAEVLNAYEEPELVHVFSAYGEITNAKTLASLVVHARRTELFSTTLKFKEAIRQAVVRGKENQYYAQVFQALRIEVNKELDALKELLIQSIDLIKPGGRLVVISYHSLEDRLVKRFIGSGKFSGIVEKDLYGNEIKPFKAVSRGAVMPDENEIKRNSRSRSARLRIAERM